MAWVVLRGNAHNQRKRTRKETKAVMNADVGDRKIGLLGEHSVTIRSVSGFESLEACHFTSIPWQGSPTRTNDLLVWRFPLTLMWE